MVSNDDVLNLVFKIKDEIEYKIDDNEIVTIYEKQEYMIQRVLRKLNFYIPKYKCIELDKYGSTVFMLIDGKNSIREIGEILEEKYQEEVYPLYERLLLFINHIEVNLKYIERIKEGVVSN